MNTRPDAVTREAQRDRLTALIKALAHSYSGEGMVEMETEALALVDELIPVPRLPHTHATP